MTQYWYDLYKENLGKKIWIFHVKLYLAVKQNLIKNTDLKRLLFHYYIWLMICDWHLCKCPPVLGHTCGNKIRQQ